MKGFDEIRRVPCPFCGEWEAHKGTCPLSVMHSGRFFYVYAGGVDSPDKLETPKAVGVEDVLGAYSGRYDLHEEKEPRYTLAEAKLKLNEQECVEEGHDCEIISGTFTGKPELVFCQRCGMKWRVGNGEKVE